MDTNAPQVINPADIRSQIVSTLNLGHLSQEDQNVVIERLSEALLERASLAVMEKLSEEQLARFSELVDAKQGEEAQKYVQSIIPDLQQVVLGAVQSGLERYKGLINEEAARAAAAGQAAPTN